MILQVSPDAPLIVHVAAAGALYLHIGAGVVALASGGVAMVARKGRKLHRASGNVFFVSMMVMAGLGAAIAPLLPQRIASVAGLLTLYLVATSWVSVKRPPGQVGRFESWAAVGGLATAALGVYLGSLGLGSPDGTLEGLPYQPSFVFAGVAALAAAGDVAVIRRGGISGGARIARHLWRMGFALLIATLSFVAQPAAIPDSIEDSPLLFSPILAVAGAMIYWLVRLRFPARFKARPARA